MKLLTVPDPVNTAGLLSLGANALDELGFEQFVVELCLPLMPRTNAAETGSAMELCQKLAGCSVGQSVELTDGAHELLAQSVARLNLPGVVLTKVLPMMHAVFSAQVKR